MNITKRSLQLCSVFLLILPCFPETSSLLAQDSLQTDKAFDAKALAINVKNSSLPGFLHLKYVTDSKNAKAFALEYNYDSSNKWQLDIITDDGGYNFGGYGAAFFAKGNYSFSNTPHFKDYAHIGGSYKKRWFNIKARSRTLNDEQNRLLRQCMAEGGLDITVDECREKLGFGRTELSYFYFDLDAHIKIEGNQDFNQRHYVYGIQVDFSSMPGRYSWLNALNIFEYPARLLRGQNDDFRHYPVFSLGLEQVDPQKDKMRSGLDIKNDIYNRLFLQIAHTSPLGTIKNYPLKLNYSVRYFYEIDPPVTIKKAGWHKFIYHTLALQLPSAIIPDLDTDKGSIIISYSAGKLPFNRMDEKIFELGWQSNYSLSDIF